MGYANVQGDCFGGLKKMFRKQYNVPNALAELLSMFFNCLPKKCQYLRKRASTSGARNCDKSQFPCDLNDT